MRKTIILQVLVLSLVMIGLYGCGKNTETQTNNTEIESNEEAGTQLNEGADTLTEEERQQELAATAEEIVTTDDSIETVQYGFDFVYPVEQLIWEKQNKEFNVNDVQLNKNWATSILINNSIISGVEPTDLSVIDNYFFTKDWPELDIFTSYNERLDGVSTISKKIGTFSRFDFTVKTKPLMANQIVSQVELVGITNVFEGGLEELREYRCADGVNFTIGNTYGEVFEILGKNSGESTTDGGTSYVTVVSYNSPNANLILYFTHENENDVNEGVLTSIIWTPTAVNEAVIKATNPNIG